MRNVLVFPTFRLLLCAIITSLAPALSAQILPPNFSCTNTPVGEVELIWDNVSNGCGSFEATEVFRATAADGPYVRIAEVTNAFETSFVDPNPNGDLRFYFLRYRYDCPGQTAINSDTLDNLIPRTPTLQYVSIEEDELVFAWVPSVSPEVVSYNILEITTTGLVPVGTVGDVTEFRLPVNNQSPSAATRSFRLVAVDACGNDSPQGPAIAAARLTGSGGEGCTNSVTLNIDQERLETFLPADNLELFVSFDGGAFVSVGTHAPSATEITFDDANDGQTVCFYVEYILTQNLGRARSEVYCQPVDINPPVRDFPLYGVERSDNGTLLFRYADDPNQGVPETALLILTRQGNLLEQADLPVPVFGGGGTLTFPSLAVPVVSGENFRFRLTDNCMREVTTNAVEPVYLSAASFVTGTNQLNWTPLINNLAGTTTYDVFRLQDNTMATPIATGLTEPIFVDELDGLSGEVCYRVTASFIPDNSPTESFAFSSNRVCVAPTAEVYVPTAFNPVSDQAVNQVFRPFFSTTVSNAAYELMVFNRWGGMVFRSLTPEIGWDGQVDGQPAATGAYLYSLRYTSGPGEERTQSGTVFLLR